MGNNSPSVLGLLVLKTLLCCGKTQDAVLTIEPKWSSFYNGEPVTFICDMNEGEDYDWHYKFIRSGQEWVPYNQHKNYTSPLKQSDEYQCCGHHKTSPKSTCSNTFYLSVSAGKPNATLTAGSTTIPIGGSVTLNCSVETSAGWKYRWFRRTSDTAEAEVRTNTEENRVISVTQGGIYRCEGLRGNPQFYSQSSHDVTIKITATMSHPVSSAFTVMMISGPVSGILIILIFLLLLCCCRRSQVGEAHLYDSVNTPTAAGNVADESRIATYSLIEQNNFGKTTSDTPTYANINVQKL